MNPLTNLVQNALKAVTNVNLISVPLYLQPNGEVIGRALPPVQKDKNGNEQIIFETDFDTANQFMALDDGSLFWFGDDRKGAKLLDVITNKQESSYVVGEEL